jgi:hypothetical protein
MPHRRLPTPRRHEHTPAILRRGQCGLPMAIKQHLRLYGPRHHRLNRTLEEIPTHRLEIPQVRAEPVGRRGDQVVTAWQGHEQLGRRQRLRGCPWRWWRRRSTGQFRRQDRVGRIPGDPGQLRQIQAQSPAPGGHGPVCYRRRTQLRRGADGGQVEGQGGGCGRGRDWCRLDLG